MRFLKALIHGRELLVSVFKSSGPPPHLGAEAIYCSSDYRENNYGQLWENRMSNPGSKSRDGTFTVIRPRFLCEDSDMGHDSSSSWIRWNPALFREHVTREH
jgi:hypothetical protein